MFVTTKFWTASLYRHQYEYIWDLSNVYVIFYQIFTTRVRFASSHQLFFMLVLFYSFCSNLFIYFTSKKMRKNKNNYRFKKKKYLDMKERRSIAS